MFIQIDKNVDIAFDFENDDENKYDHAIVFQRQLENDRKFVFDVQTLDKMQIHSSMI